MRAPVDETPNQPLSNGTRAAKESHAQRIIDRGDFTRSLQARRERRLCDTSIPAGASLPQPLVPFLTEYLCLSDTSIAVPEPIITAIHDLEAAVRQLPSGFSQVEVSVLLQSFAARFTEAPVGADVFAAIIDTFYASDFISGERAQELAVFAVAGTGKGRTLRELLLADD